MTDALHFLTEFKINNEFFYNLFFVGTIISAFFGCDYWLLIKHPETYNKDIKLVDFFITRLRLFVPISVIMLFLGFYSHLLEDENGFLFTFSYITACFYFSSFYYQFFTKKPNELLEGVLILSISYFPIFGSKFYWLGRIVYMITIFLSFLLIMALYIKCIKKTTKK